MVWISSYSILSFKQWLRTFTGHRKIIQTRFQPLLSKSLERMEPRIYLYIKESDDVTKSSKLEHAAGGHYYINNKLQSSSVKSWLSQLR